jgi:hypothetical protein
LQGRCSADPDRFGLVPNTTAIIAASILCIEEGSPMKEHGPRPTTKGRDSWLFGLGVRSGEDPMAIG